MFVSETYSILDCWYVEDVPNGSLKQGQLVSNATVSSDWSSVGEYSIKADISNSNWSGYRIINPTISKQGILELDFNTSNNNFTLAFLERINNTDREENQRIFTSDGNTARLSFDFSEYDGTVNYFEVRVVKYGSETNPVYIDNIRIYPI